MLLCQAVHRSAEPNSIVLVIDKPERAKRIAAMPKACYLTPHYEPHASMLVRLSSVDRKALLDLLNHAWFFVTSGH